MPEMKSTISQPRTSTRKSKSIRPTIDDLFGQFREVIGHTERSVQLIKERLNRPELRRYPLNHKIGTARLGELYEQMYCLADFINVALKRDTR